MPFSQGNIRGENGKFQVGCQKRPRYMDNILIVGSFSIIKLIFENLRDYDLEYLAPCFNLHSCQSCI